MPVRAAYAPMVLAMLVMLGSAGAVSAFVDRHPSVKTLALAFLLLIGVVLVAAGMGSHVDKGYIYFAMAFSLFVEMLKLRYRKKRQPVTLYRRFEEEEWQDLARLGLHRSARADSDGQP